MLFPCRIKWGDSHLRYLHSPLDKATSSQFQATLVQDLRRFSEFHEMGGAMDRVDAVFWTKVWSSMAVISSKAWRSLSKPQKILLYFKPIQYVDWYDRNVNTKIINSTGYSIFHKSEVSMNIQSIYTEDLMHFVGHLLDQLHIWPFSPLESGRSSKRWRGDELLRYDGQPLGAVQVDSFMDNSASNFVPSCSFQFCSTTAWQSFISRCRPRQWLSSSLIKFEARFSCPAFEPHIAISQLWFAGCHLVGNPSGSGSPTFFYMICNGSSLGKMESCTIESFQELNFWQHEPWICSLSMGAYIRPEFGDPLGVGHAGLDTQCKKKVPSQVYHKPCPEVCASSHTMFLPSLCKLFRCRRTNMGQNRTRFVLAPATRGWHFWWFTFFLVTMKNQKPHQRMGRREQTDSWWMVQALLSFIHSKDGPSMSQLLDIAWYARTISF